MPGRDAVYLSYQLIQMQQLLFVAFLVSAWDLCCCLVRFKYVQVLIWGVESKIHIGTTFLC